MHTTMHMRFQNQQVTSQQILYILFLWIKSANKKYRIYFTDSKQWAVREWRTAFEMENKNGVTKKYFFFTYSFQGENFLLLLIMMPALSYVVTCDEPQWMKQSMNPTASWAYQLLCKSLLISSSQLFFDDSWTWEKK